MNLIMTAVCFQRLSSWHDACISNSEWPSYVLSSARFYQWSSPLCLVLWPRGDTILDQRNASTLNRMVLQYAAQASLLPRSQASPAGGLGHHGAVREWPESCSQHLERRDDEAA